jgi:hypothetical protein
MLLISCSRPASDTIQQFCSQTNWLNSKTIHAVLPGEFINRETHDQKNGICKFDHKLDHGNNDKKFFSENTPSCSISAMLCFKRG